jgi:hypothetical protein
MLRANNVTIQLSKGKRALNEEIIFTDNVQRFVDAVLQPRRTSLKGYNNNTK